jgi:hypothetical protein
LEIYMQNEHSSVVAQPADAGDPPQTNNNDGGNQPPKAKAPKLEPDEQAWLDNLIREKQGKAGREARERGDALERENQLLREKLREQPDGRSAELELEVSKLRSELEGSTRRAAIERAANEAGALAPDIINGLFASRVIFDESRGFIVKPEHEGDAALTLADAIRKLESERPYLFHGSMKGGTGSTPSKGIVRPAIQLETMFGPGSDARLANQYAMQHGRDAYRKLREKAKERGLL